MIVLFIFLQKHCCLNETKRYQQDDDFTKLHAYIDCQQPIPDLYTFIGNLTVVKESGEILHKPLGPENVLLRGARLKNTPFIYGKQIKCCSVNYGSGYEHFVILQYL